MVQENNLFFKIIFLVKRERYSIGLISNSWSACKSQSLEFESAVNKTTKLTKQTLGVKSKELLREVATKILQMMKVSQELSDQSNTDSLSKLKSELQEKCSIRFIYRCFQKCYFIVTFSQGNCRRWFRVWNMLGEDANKNWFSTVGILFALIAQVRMC